MLKHLVILAVLATATVGLLEGQTAPLSTPKEGIAKTDSSQDRKNQSEASQTQKTPIKLTPYGVEIKPAPCDETCQQGRRNLEIQGKLEWFTGVLAFVGVLQVVAGGLQIGTMIWQAKLLKGTLVEIQTQAGHMGSQTKILEDSVAAAQKSADAALAQVEASKSTQRAQLRIEFTEPDFAFDEELGGYPIRFQVTMDGTSRAYIPDSAIFAYMDRTARQERKVSMGMHIPRNFTPEMSPIEDYTLIRKNDFPPEVDTDPGKPDLVHNHNFTVFVDGYIRYRDVFGDDWILEIDRVWTPNSRHWGEDATGGNWYPSSSGRNNANRKVEYQKQT